LLSVADVVQIEKYSLSLHISKSKDLRKSFHNDSFDAVRKSTVLLKYVKLWRNKALHGQWPKLMEQLHTDSLCNASVDDA